MLTWYSKTQTDSLLAGKAPASALTSKADLVGGVVPTSQLPAIALETAVPVANRAAMLALTARRCSPATSPSTPRTALPAAPTS